MNQNDTIGTDPARWDQVIPGLGKFEAECEFSRHYYDVGMDGGADESFGATDVFRLDASDAYDAAILAAEPEAYAVFLTETDNGFVFGKTVTRSEYDAAAAEYAAEQTDGDS